MSQNKKSVTDPIIIIKRQINEARRRTPGSSTLSEHHLSVGGGGRVRARGRGLCLTDGGLTVIQLKLPASLLLSNMDMSSFCFYNRIIETSNTTDQSPL